MRVTPHVREIAEASKRSRGPQGEVLGRDELAIGQEADADNEVLDSIEAQLRALSPHRIQRCARLQRQVTRTTNGPGILAQRLYQRLHKTQRRFGIQYEIRDPTATWSLNQSEQLCRRHIAQPLRACREDLNARLRSDVKPMRVDGFVAGNQA